MKSIVLMLIVIIICFISGCSILKFKPSAVDIGINEAGFQTTLYLFRDSIPIELEVAKSVSTKLIENLSEENIETRITVTLAEIFKLVAKEKEFGIDKKVKHYIDKAVRFLNVSIDLEQTSKKDAINIYRSYMSGVIEGLLYLESPKII